MSVEHVQGSHGSWKLGESGTPENCQESQGNESISVKKTNILSGCYLFILYRSIVFLSLCLGFQIKRACIIWSAIFVHVNKE